MLKLGNVVFDIDDYPEELPIGGSSLVTVEKYPGGRKMVQNFGAYDDAITFTGTFRYQTALQKTRAVDAIWRAAQPVQLIVDSLSPRWVIITAFKPVYRNDYEIPYSITLEVLTSSDLNAVIYNANPSTSQPGTSVVTDTTAPQRTYTVQTGDTLWKIAAKAEYYGDGSQYTKIVAANNIKDPSQLQPGQQLVIPA